MTNVLGEAPVAAALGGLLGLVVVAALIFSAIARYRSSQRAIDEKHRLAKDEADRLREQAIRDARRGAEISRIAFESQRARVKDERPRLVAASKTLLGELRRGGWDETSLLAPDEWLPAHPIHLDPDRGGIGVRLAVEDGRKPAGAVQDALRAAGPRTPDGHPYEHVVDAIIAFEAPAPSKYVNRDCYRVLDLAVVDGHVDLTLDATTYFTVLDEAVLLECEIAAAASATDAERPAADDLPLRTALGDPYVLAGRTAAASVSTLVLRRAADGSAEFWLHRRRTVGMVGGQTHVVPTGVFQPAVEELPEVFERDAQTWFTVVRELAEELMGVWDADGRAVAPDAYETQSPLADIEAARRSGEARPWFVGAGLDPLSYWVELLTVLVVDEAAFDRLLGDPPRENGEGTVLGRTRPDGSHGGHPFTRDGLDEILSGDPLAPAADALLRLAWRHRDALLRAA